jgi:hypothetical protein
MARPAARRTSAVRRAVAIARRRRWHVVVAAGELDEIRNLPSTISRQ